MMLLRCLKLSKRSPHQWVRVVAALLIIAASPATASSVPPKGVLEFAAIRNGEEIGNCVLRFVRTENRLSVVTDIHIKVKILFVTVFRFDLHVNEVWNGERLISMQASSDDDGTRKAVTVVENADASSGNELVVAVKGKEMHAPPTAIPTTLWNSRLIETPVAIDTVDGTVLHLIVHDLGFEVIQMGGQTAPARHFRFEAEGFVRELWYDQNGVLSAVRQWGKDGSQVDYVLMR
jgi:hypothetical protein